MRIFFGACGTNGFGDADGVGGSDVITSAASLGTSAFWFGSCRHSLRASSSCSCNGQTLAIGNQGLPRIGLSFQVMYTGPNFTFSPGQQIAWPNLVLGFGQQSTPIPAGFLPQQPAGCQGYITPEVVLPTVPDPNGRPQFENFVVINVPNNPGLLGMQLHAQWLTIVQQCGFAGCNFAAVLTSDAALLQIGQ